MSKPEIKSDRIKKMFGHRFIAGTWSAFAAVVIIVIAIVVNLIVSSLPKTTTQIDLTENSLYSLSDQTKQILGKLDKDVTLYLLATSGAEDPTITRFLSQYTAISDHIKVEIVDPGERPTFLDGYDLGTSGLFQNSVIVDCGGRYRFVSYNDIYVVDYSMDYYSYNYSTTTSFNGENAITNAIHYVTNDELPKVYVLNGHGEAQLSSEITNMIKQDNMEYETLSMISMESIPEDASAILINAPANDLGDDETEILMHYLVGGGNVILLTDYIVESEMPNLLKLTQVMGLTVQPGIIIEADRNMYAARYPHYILPEIASHDITEALRTGGYYIMTPVAQPIIQSESSAANITWLLTTSDSAYAKLAALDMETTEKEEGDTDGPFYVGAVSENGGKLLWITSGSLLNNSIDRTVSGANSNLVLNALNWMGGHEESISIRAKSLDEERLTVPASTSGFWAVIMIGLIPAAMICIGIVIYIRRKRR